MVQRFPKVFPPFMVGPEQRRFIMELADENMSYPGQVMRQAIVALFNAPETEVEPLERYGNMLPTMRVTEGQMEFVDGLAKSLDVSRAQVLRNAIYALSNSLEKEK